MINVLFSRLSILAFGTLYPGYISFKTVRAKNVEGYVRWMIYWIVFSIFSAVEAVADIFLTWFPFYYEFKVVFILWLLPVIGNGSSLIYKKIIHPLLKKHEPRVDYHLNQVRERGQDLALHYIKEAVILIGMGIKQGMRGIGISIIDEVNKSLPNGVLGFLGNNNIASGSSVQNSQNIIIEEIEDQHVSRKVTSRRKNSAKGNKDAGEVLTAPARVRKTRQSKQEIDSNLNES